MPPTVTKIQLEPTARSAMDALAFEERDRVLQAIDELADRADGGGDGCVGISGFVIGFHREIGLLRVTWIQRTPVPS